jgi:WD40 repeat protein
MSGRQSHGSTSKFGFCFYFSRKADGIFQQDFNPRTIFIFNLCLKTVATFFIVCFSPDEQYLLSSNTNGTLNLWEVATKTHWKSLKAQRLYEGMNITGIRGISESAIELLKQLGAVEA